MVFSKRVHLLYVNAPASPGAPHIIFEAFAAGISATQPVTR